MDDKVRAEVLQVINSKLSDTDTTGGEMSVDMPLFPGAVLFKSGNGASMMAAVTGQGQGQLIQSVSIVVG